MAVVGKIKFQTSLLSFLLLFSIQGKTTECALHLQLLTSLTSGGAVIIDGKMVKTSNKFGTSIIQTDPYVENFLETAQAVGEVLEIGAGHGFTTTRVLEQGQAKITVNDLSLDNLGSLRAILAETSDEIKNRVRWQEGRFPNAFVSYSDSSFDAILMARVLHFFRPDEFSLVLREVHRLLRSGGSVTVTALSPENSHFKGFYKNYLKNILNQNPWPGSNVRVEDYRPNAPLPEYIHLLDPHVLVREFLAAGFRIEKAGYIDRSGQYPADVLLGKREGVGIKAMKR